MNTAYRSHSPATAYRPNTGYQQDRFHLNSGNQTYQSNRLDQYPTHGTYNDIGEFAMCFPGQLFIYMVHEVAYHGGPHYRGEHAWRAYGFVLELERVPLCRVSSDFS